MLTRAYVLVAALVVAAASCYAAKPIVRDGSTMEKAIALKQRGRNAVEEEMAWMMKLYHYTPLLATRDAMVDAVRKANATKKPSKARAPWEHGSLDHDGHLISYWWFLTPRGKKEIYFDTGTSINTPGEVARQESARAKYMAQMAQSLKLQ
jgi:hypothetical protein